VGGDAQSLAAGASRLSRGWIGGGPRVRPAGLRQRAPGIDRPVRSPPAHSAPAEGGPEALRFGAAPSEARYGAVRKNDEESVWFPPASIESTSHS